MSSRAGEVRVESATPAVVLIDDDRDLLDLLVRHLRNAVPDHVAYDLTLAYSPEDGWDRIQGIRSDRPLIVFCDFNLQAGTTGADLLVEIGRSRPRALRILISGHTADYLRPALEACRPDAYLEKPLDMASLASRMAAFVVRAADKAVPAPHITATRRELAVPLGGGQAQLQTTTASTGTGTPAPQPNRNRKGTNRGGNLEPLDATRTIHHAVDDRYFRLMAESLTDYAAFLLDVEGHIVTWTPGAQRIKGYTAEEIIGEHFSRFYPQPDVDARKPTFELRRAAESGRFENTGWRIRKDGSRFWANVVITALRDDEGTLLGFAKLTRDLTQQRHAEEMLRESEARYRLLIENVRDYAIIMLDTDGYVLSWSEGAYQSTGYSAETALGKHFGVFYTEDSRNAGEPDADLRRAVEEGRHEEEGWRLRQDGSRFWANVVTTPLYDHLGQHRGFAQVMRDLTTRREAEETARRQTEELKDVMRELDAFNDAVAHDLRGPVRALLGYATLLEEDQPGVEERRLFLGRIRASAERMAQLIDDLLDLSRSTKSDMHRTEVDLSGLAEEIVDKLVTERRGERAGFHVAPGMKARADAGLLRIALENLIENAVKFSAGRTLRVEVGQTQRNGDQAFFVRDRGIGFDPDQAQSLFRPFVRLHGGDEYEGTGIGLATVHRIIARHGGRVWAESAPGQGATFVFTLG